MRWFFAFFLLCTSAMAQKVVPGLDSSANTVTAPGTGAVARTFAVATQDVINAADYGLKTVTAGGTGSGNRTALINAIAQACAAPVQTVWIGAGNFTLDVTSGEILDQCAGTGSMVSIIGSGSGSTFFGVTNIGNNNVFHLSPPAGQPNIGHGTLSGFRIFQNTANATAGAGIALEKTNSVTLHDVEIDNAFTNLDCISCVGTRSTDIYLSGSNSSSGASLTKFRRSSNSTGNNNASENFFTNANIRAGSPGSYQNSIVINDCDGCWFTGSHIGFSSGAILLVQPGFIASGAGTRDDQIDGLHFIGTDFDTSSAGNCIDFEHLASFAGGIGGIWFTGGSCYHAALDGVLLNDSSVSSIAFSGFVVTDSQNNGLNIQAGSGIDWSGGKFIENNLANNGSFQALIGGNAAHVVLSGANFIKGTAATIPNNISVGGAADYVNIGANDYQGSAGADVVYSSSGTHNQAPAASTTDQTNGVWVDWQIASGNTGYYLNNQAGKNLIKFFSGTGTNGNVNTISVNTAGSGGIPSVNASGADGTNTPAQFSGNSNGKTYIGATGSPGIVLQAHVISTQSVAPTLPSCGTGPSVNAQSTDHSFEFTTGTGTPTTCAASFNISYATAPKCTVSAQTSAGVPIAAAVTTKSTSGITITLASGQSGAIIDGICEQ